MCIELEKDDIEVTGDPKSGNSLTTSLLKIVVGVCSGFIGLRVGTGDGGVCNMLVNDRWPDEDIGGLLRAASTCDGNPLLFFGVAAAAGYLVFGYLAEQRRNFIAGIFVGLVAGALAGAAAAFSSFLSHFGWP